MLVSVEGAPVDPDLEIIALTDSSWRVCDSRYSPAEPGGLLAYIEHADGGYSVLLMRPGMTENLRSDCFAGALALVSSRRMRTSTDEFAGRRVRRGGAVPAGH